LFLGSARADAHAGHHELEKQLAETKKELAENRSLLVECICSWQPVTNALGRAGLLYSGLD
jgi:hypothetical protein